MRYILLIISIITLVCCPASVQAQKSAQRYTYFSYDYDSDHTDTATTVATQQGATIRIVATDRVSNPIAGYAETSTYADYLTDSIYYTYRYSDSTYLVASTMRRNDIRWDTQKIDSKTTRYTTSINSNSIELVFVDKGKGNANPLPYYGHFDGVLLSMTRNGLVQMELGKTEKIKSDAKPLAPESHSVRKTAREMSALRMARMVTTTHIFDNEQICWGKERPATEEIPFDTTLHYAGGTIILKRVMLPKLPSHYQTFVELRQRSNGDAYDRTGSVFVIPDAGDRQTPTFLDGMTCHPDSLPIVRGSDGERYQGITLGISPMHRYRNSTHTYRPPVELMRFFTPFGVGKFNDRVQIEGLEWEEETFYKQEVTELQPLLEGEVWIGVFIGNYDGGGHIVSLDLKSYPNDYEQSDSKSGTQILQLINTCNVLEMSGQNYGKIFGTDSLTVAFDIPANTTKATLRYISTGHGGWGGGDEFNPKENILSIDGLRRFSHTPWRCDCGRYREWNPVSGNFWNGLSSSDLSRSGWCPGTATQPIFFDLTGLTPGRHTLTVTIPQGAPMEGGFSHWSVSATLILEEQQ